MKKYFLVVLTACSIQETKVKAPTPTLESITGIAETSTCADVEWANRGKAPMGYMKGMALVYARALCNQSSPAMQIISMAESGNPSSDALTWYKSQFNKFGWTNEGGVDTLRHSFTLLIGLGMRESSGRYCCGRDGSASNFTSDTVEAGIFQTSWNANYFSSVARNLTREDTGCFSEVFKEGVKCSNGDLKNWGSGRGLQFQIDSKDCPAYGAVFAGIMLRKAGGSKGHYGPLRRYEAEVRAECNTMLSKIEKVIQENHELCTVLK